MDEFSLIAAALSHCSDTTSLQPQSGVGPGDDAAVVEFGGQLLTISVDTYVEDIHFRCDWMSAEQIGARSVEGSISDIAAMGGEPEYILIQLMCPKGSADEQFVFELYSGINQACLNSELKLLGGDMTSGSAYSLGVTALGRIPEGQQPVCRSGMKPGDKICVSGSLGGSAAGLALCRAGKREPKRCVEAFFAPKARNDIGVSIGRVATAMIDISDGLSSELHHLSVASGCGICLFEENVPISPGVKDAALILGDNPRDWVLHGGEEYQLLFSIGENDGVPPGCTIIGEANSGDGVVVVTGCGEEQPLIAGGYTHG